jgi:hypothetical protein
MERSDWIERCEKVDRLLRQIRQRGPASFTPEEDKYFQESLDANELGVAFDLLCWKFGETGQPISEAVYELLVSAGSMMDISASAWTKLKPTHPVRLLASHFRAGEEVVTVLGIRSLLTRSQHSISTSSSGMLFFEASVLTLPMRCFTIERFGIKTLSSK